MTVPATVESNIIIVPIASIVGVDPSKRIKAQHSWTLAMHINYSVQANTLS